MRGNALASGTRDATIPLDNFQVLMQQAVEEHYNKVHTLQMELEAAHAANSNLRRQILALRSGRSGQEGLQQPGSIIKHTLKASGPQDVALGGELARVMEEPDISGMQEAASPSHTKVRMPMTLEAARAESSWEVMVRSMSTASGRGSASLGHQYAQETSAEVRFLARPRPAPTSPEETVHAVVSEASRDQDPASTQHEQDDVRRHSVRSRNSALAFLPLPCWEKEPPAPTIGGKSKSSLSGGKLAQTATSQFEEDGELKGAVLRRRNTDAVVEDPTSPLTRFIIPPSSKYRLMWDMAGLLLLGYDVVVIPLALCFEVQENDFEKVMFWASLVFWTLDIVGHFFLGYVERGVNVMQPRRIMVHYATTWFGVDALPTVVDYITVAVGMNFDDYIIVRTNRFLRLFRLYRIMLHIEEHIYSELAEVVVDIVKLITFVLIISHVIACLWYAIGNQDIERDWVTAHDMDDESLEYRYTTSLHWALTKLVLESMDVEPHNLPERRFAVITQIFGLAVFSSTISRITSSMIQLQSLRDHSSKQFWLLRRYLRERAVDQKLSLRIQRYLKYVVMVKLNYVSTSAVTILYLLSPQLKDELNYAVSVPHMAMHPFFAHVSKVSDVTMFRLIRDCISQLSLARDDSLFFSGEASSSMFFVISGNLQYIEDDLKELMGGMGGSPKPRRRSRPSFRSVDQSGHSAAFTMTMSRPVRSPLARSPMSRPRSVSHEDWMCEPALWTQWVHLGDLHAMTESNLICIDAERFSEVMCASRSSWTLASRYCRRYVDCLNSMALHELCDLGGGRKEQEVLVSLIDEFKGMLRASGSPTPLPTSRTWSLPLAGSGPLELRKSHSPPSNFF